MIDNRRAILISACIQASATVVSEGEYGDPNSPDYPVDAIAKLARMLTDELLHDATVASAEYQPKES
ncbi:MAG: hypothetical protein OEY85_04920 [Rhodospirillales bacterium]|nr:hypothetical protein [Rhodospirillales bacterium]